MKKRNGEINSMVLPGFTKKWIVGTLCLISCLFSFVCVGAGSESPKHYLKPYLTRISEILEDCDIDRAAHSNERREKVMDIAVEFIDFREMSARVLGSTWQKISINERKRFVNLFTKLLEHAYIGKLESCSDHKIKYLGERFKGNRAVVITEAKNKKTTIKVNYVMINRGIGWKVYDVNIEGVSLLRNYMQQFRSILRREDFYGLVRILEEKNRLFEGN